MLLCQQVFFPFLIIFSNYFLSHYYFNDIQNLGHVLKFLHAVLHLRKVLKNFITALYLCSYYCIYYLVTGIWKYHLSIFLNLLFKLSGLDDYTVLIKARDTILIFFKCVKYKMPMELNLNILFLFFKVWRKYYQINLCLFAPIICIILRSWQIR